MKIYNLDYCHSATPELLVSVAGGFKLSAEVYTSNNTKGQFDENGEFKVENKNKTTLNVEGLGFQQDPSFASIFITNETGVQRRPSGLTSIHNINSASANIGVGGLFFPAVTI